MSKRSTDSEQATEDFYKLELVGLSPADERPEIALRMFDRKNAVLHEQDIGADGGFTIPAQALKIADRVVLGAPDDKGSIRSDASISYRANEFLAQINDSRLVLAEGAWSRFRFHWACVSGSVQVCRRRPRWFDRVVAEATAVRWQFDPLANGLSSGGFLKSSALERLSPSLNDLMV